jgi:hypothetical protein
MQHVLEPGRGRAWVESPYLRSLVVSSFLPFPVQEWRHFLARAIVLSRARQIGAARYSWL